MVGRVASVAPRAKVLTGLHPGKSASVFQARMKTRFPAVTLCQLLRGLAGLLLLPVAVAVPAQDSAPFFECPACDAAQMRQAALDEPGLGLRVVYSLDAELMLKFRVFEDPACASEPAEGCASAGLRQVEELPVDASLAAPFATMLAMHANVPPFVEAGKVAMPIGLVNDQLEAPQAPFDPYRVAFDRLSGDSYQRFERAAAGVVSNQELMRRLNPPIASLIFDVWAPVRLARIEQGPSMEGIPLAPRFAIDEFIVDFVSGERHALVSMRFTSADMGILQARDETGVLLPAREDLDASRFERRFSGTGAMDSANRLGDFLARNADLDFAPTQEVCAAAYLLVCTKEQKRRACRIDCEP